VEFTLLLPILVFIMLMIADFSRLYATMITVEAAAREAADYGTLYPWLWEGDQADPATNAGKTVASMRQRACVAASRLPDYAGPNDDCVNPSFSYRLDSSAAGAGVTEAQCATRTRTATPCNVEVTLAYTFRLLVPLNMRLGDLELGLPSTISFTRQSVFAISDFEIDRRSPAPVTP
jgi:Flp pilus assembly protein TadG